MTVKTAISLDDKLLERVDALARETGLSRSRLFALAMSGYLEQYENQRILESLTEVYGDPAAQSRSAENKAFAAAHRSGQLKQLEDDEW